MDSEEPSPRGTRSCGRGLALEGSLSEAGSSVAGPATLKCWVESSGPGHCWGEGQVENPEQRSAEGSRSMGGGRSLNGQMEPCVPARRALWRTSPGARRLSEACFSTPALAPCSGIVTSLVAYGFDTVGRRKEREAAPSFPPTPPLPVGIGRTFPVL